VTFRLADSLPKEVYEQWKREQDEALRQTKNLVGQASSLPDASKEKAGWKPAPLTDAEQLAEELRQKLDAHLDQGHGECWLRNPEISGLVENSLRHFDGQRYLRGSFVVMPNHVHVLVRPVMEHKLSDILHSWKSFTANEANKLLGRSGQFWQDESFDHIVRDEHQVERFQHYIHENPAKAHLLQGEFKLGIGCGGKESIVGQASSLPDSQQAGWKSAPLAPIRFGLAAIKGVGEVAVEAILKARNESGKFKTLSELCERVDGRSLGRKTLEALIKTGACDCFGQTRATLSAQIERTLARAASILSDKQKGQSSLFGALEEKAPAMPEAISNLPEWPQHELLAHEKELLGFYVTGHPLTPFAPILEKYALANTAKLAELPNRSLTRIGGLIAAVQHGVSKKNGKPYSMVTLEDLEGSVQVLVMNENYDKYREMLKPNKAILVVGEVNTGDEKPKIFPQEIMPLEDAPRKFTKQVHLRLHTAHLKPEHLDAVGELVVAHPGKCPLFLCFMRPGGETVFVETHDRFQVAPSLELEHAANKLFGEETYYAKVDTTLPERQQRRWERKADNGNGEE
jgi:hypothetical protein